MHTQIEIPQEEIADFCQRWQVVQLAFFGSVLRNELRPDSDLDILVSFDPETRHTLIDMVRMQEELQHVFGRPVDLVSRRAIERSRNYLRRNAILKSMKVIHGT